MHMKQKKNFTAIVATVMATMNGLVTSSCNSDSEYDGYGFYTRAEGLFTQSGDPGWGGSETTSNNTIETYVHETFDKIEFGDISRYLTVDVTMKIDTLLNKATCKVTNYDFNTILSFKVNAKEFDYKNNKCNMTFEITSDLDGTITVNKNVTYTIKK